jgi:hypothetical protein
MPPYAPPGEGDSYNFAMLHVTGGDIQFNGAGRARQIMLHTVVARRPATSFAPMEPPSRRMKHRLLTARPSAGRKPQPAGSTYPFPQQPLVGVERTPPA